MRQRIVLHSLIGLLYLSGTANAEDVTPGSPGRTLATSVFKEAQVVGAAADGVARTVTGAADLASAALGAGANYLARSTEIEGQLKVRNTVNIAGAVDIKAGGAADVGSSSISNIKAKTVTVVNDVTLQSLNVGVLGAASIGASSVQNAEIGNIDILNEVQAGRITVGTGATLRAGTSSVK